jgi:ABC-type sulfate/molybdate transport systems ATPase subunit
VTPLLEAHELRVRRGDTEVLHGVDLSVDAGEVVAVLGPNGAGKSTLLETLGGVLAPDAGTVQRRGRVATALQPADLAARSVRHNVELALAWWGVPRGQRRIRAIGALEATAARGLERRHAASLSGGERRRVHLARAVAIAPDILLLDEPFAGLDSATRASLLDDTGAALRGESRAVIVVVHDRAEAWALADRIVVLDDGKVVANGAPRDLLDRPPTPAVARFLGYSGELRDGRGRLMTRATQVHLDPSGDITATVRRVIPLEDGARAELETPAGRLAAIVPFPGPGVGAVVQVRIDGGVRYPR